MKMLRIALLSILFCGATIAAEAQQPQDWANYRRFAEQNTTAQHGADLIIIGNSITEGWITKRPQFFTDNGYISRGISGQTTSQMLCRFRADVINLEPKIVAIAAGTNDIAQNTGYIAPEHIFENIQSMVELAEANGIRVIICALLPADDFSWRRGLEPAQKIIDMNKRLAAYAAEKGIPFVDYHTPLATPAGALDPAYTTDGVHPTESGYEIMEKILPPVVNQVLADINKCKKGGKCKAKGKR